jgi:hypothetical protein
VTGYASRPYGSVAAALRAASALSEPARACAAITLLAVAVAVVAVKVLG